MERWERQTLSDLERHEGFRPYAYPDPLSPMFRKYSSRRIRWGFRPAREIMKELGITDPRLGSPWTVGFGFTRGVTPDSHMTIEEARPELYRELIAHLTVLDRLLPEWQLYPGFVKTVLANLAFNMGSRLGQFKNTLRYFHQRDWLRAATNLEKSLWYQQVGGRARELVWRLKNEMVQPEFLVADFSNVRSSVTSTEEVKRQGE